MLLWVCLEVHVSLYNRCSEYHHVFKEVHMYLTWCNNHLQLHNYILYCALEASECHKLTLNFGQLENSEPRHHCFIIFYSGNTFLVLMKLILTLLMYSINSKIMPPWKKVDWSLLVSTFFKNQRLVVKFFRQCFHLLNCLTGILQTINFINHLFTVSKITHLFISCSWFAARY